MKEVILKIISDSVDLKQKTIQKDIDKIIKIVNVIDGALRKGGKIIIFGNGGSAADSQHIAAELIGRFQKERKSIPAIALTTDTSILTALSNDYGFDIIFSRQIEGLGSKKDIALGLSTSGNSSNVLKAMKAARKIGMKTISLTGGVGGSIAKASDFSIVVPSKITARVQEVHICLAHILCELIEEKFSKR